MRHWKFLCFAVFLTISAVSNAQFYSSGSDPASIKWNQIKSPYFKVVFPKEFEREARRFTALLDSLYLHGGHSLDHKPKPIQVLMHSRDAYSNGFVSWAPKRMEIYTTPHQDMFAQDWLEQLAIHEFRHVVQIDKLNQGFTRGLSFFFGQQAIGAVLGLYAPMWFLEGDATLTETMLSPSGRGRKPEFEQQLRAQLLEKGSYHYDKAYFGSYKDYIPNHYHMGYLLVSGARYEYGADVWERALSESGRHSWSITPFNRGIKEVTGMNKVPLYNSVFNQWKEDWQAQEKTLTYSSFTPLTKRDPNYKNYRWPTPIDAHRILAEVDGPGEIRRFVEVNTATGKESTILIPGSREREPFSYNAGQLVWTELKPHPRWENQMFSVIRIKDLKSGKQRKITSRSRYFAPALSPDGKTIATVHVSDENDYSIHLLNAENGNLIKTIVTPSNQFPMTPAWHENGRELVLILLGDEGKKITLLDTDHSKWTALTSPDFAQIRLPRFDGNNILYCGSWTGIENIYRITKEGKNLEQLSSSRFGAAMVMPSATPENIIYSEYTSDGYVLVSASENELQPQAFTPQALPVEQKLKKMQAEEKGLPDLKGLTGDAYTVKKYSKWNLFNFHSWAPAFVDIDEGSIGPGVSALSQNLLNTTFVTVGYNGDSQNSRERYYANLAYKGWWPVFDLEMKFGDDKTQSGGYYRNETDTFRIHSIQKATYTTLEGGVKVPLNLSCGQFFRSIEPGVRASYQKRSGYEYLQSSVSRKKEGLEDTDTLSRQVESFEFTSLEYKLFTYNLKRSAQRDVTTRWGQVVEFNYRHTPAGTNDYGSIIGLHTRLYFPGIGRHHAIRLDNDYHRKDRGDKWKTDNGLNYYLDLPDFVKFPRGVNGITNDELYSFKGDYLFPLLNPDWNVPGVLYMKRITMNLFYDYSLSVMNWQNSTTSQWTRYENTFQSMGSEIRGELHPFRFVFPITVGYRYAWLPESKNHFHEFLLTLNFSGFTVNN